MLEFLRRKQQKHPENRSLTRTETSKDKLAKTAMRLTSRTENMFPHALKSSKKDKQGPEQNKKQRRSTGMLQNYFSGEPFHHTQKNIQTPNTSQHQNQLIIKRFDEAMEKDARKIVVARALSSYKQLQTPNGTLTSLSSHRDSAARPEMDPELQRRKISLQQSLKSNKLKILESFQRSQKAISLRHFLSGKSENGFGTQNIEQIKKDYESKIQQLTKRQAYRIQQERMDNARRQIERQTQLKKYEERKEIQRQQMEAALRKRQQNTKMELQKAQIELAKKREELQRLKQQTKQHMLLQRNIHSKPIQSKNQQILELKSKPKQTHSVLKDQEEFSIIKLIAPEQKPKQAPSYKLQPSIDELCSAPIVELGTVKRQSKQVKKDQVVRPQILPNSHQIKEVKGQSVAKKPYRIQDQDELQEIVLEKPKAFKSTTPPIPNPPPTPPNITIIPAKESIPQPSQFNQKPLNNIEKKPPLAPQIIQSKIPLPKQQQQEQSEQVDIDELKVKLNMVGETIGYGSKDLKGIPVNWMVPCFFLYRKFYQLRLALLKQFQLLQKDKLATKEEINEINQQNIKVKASLEKMAAACEKKCSNPEIKPRFKEKFEANVNTVLMNTTQAYMQEVAKLQNTLPTDQKDKVKQHLLQILNAILIIQEFEGKDTEPLTTVQIYSEKAKANLDRLIKQHHSDILKFQKMK